MTEDQITQCQELTAQRTHLLKNLDVLENDQYAVGLEVSHRNYPHPGFQLKLSKWEKSFIIEGIRKRIKEINQMLERI